MEPKYSFFKKLHSIGVSPLYLIGGQGPMLLSREDYPGEEGEKPFNPYILKSAFIGSMASWEKSGNTPSLQKAAEHMVDLYYALQEAMEREKSSDSDAAVRGVPSTSTGTKEKSEII